jgi:hypothetical protein
MPAEEDRRRERAALLTIGFTLILIVLSASNVASRVAPFAGQLKDYGPLVAVGVTIMAAMVYRAFQVRAIPLELVIGTCMGIMIAVALTLLGANVQNGSVAFLILSVAILVALAIFDTIKWDFGRAERAAIISTLLVLLILWATGLIKVTLGGHSWLKVEFVGQTLMTVDSSFPLLAALDLLTAAVCGLLLAILYWRWSAFQKFVLQVAPSSDDETVAQSDGQKRFQESLLRLAPSFVSKTAVERRPSASSPYGLVPSPS